MTAQPDNAVRPLVVAASQALFGQGDLRALDARTLAAALAEVPSATLDASEVRARGLPPVADLMAATLRGGDFVGLRGEEFVLLLPDTDRGGAAVVAEKLRKAIAELRLPGH